jgi:hypothetical protein
MLQKNEKELLTAAGKAIGYILGVAMIAAALMLAVGALRALARVVLG